MSSKEKKLGWLKDYDKYYVTNEKGNLVKNPLAKSKRPFSGIGLVTFNWVKSVLGLRA